MVLADTCDSALSEIFTKIQQGTCILFTGAGINKGAFNSAGKEAPMGSELATLIKQEFFPNDDVSSDLATIAACAETRRSRPELYRFIHSVFIDFKPSPALACVPKLRWRRIYTTNYDILLERAYEQAGSTKLQDLNPVYTSYDTPVYAPGQRLAYYKLHGCITKISPPKPGLVLTHQDYVRHQEDRHTLFLRLQEELFYSTFLFVGYSLRDPNFQRLFFEVQDTLGQDNFPRSYAIMPEASPPECEMWDSKRISILPLTAEQVLTELASRPPISPPAPPGSASAKALTAHLTPIIDLKTASELSNAFEFISKNLGSGRADHEGFYKGNKADWDIIRANCDGSRDLYEQIMDEFLLVEEPKRSSQVDLAVITAEAGAGKSTLLMRLAYDLGTSFECLCLMYRPGREVHANALEELYRRTKRRIFVFVDQAAANVDKIRFICGRAKASGIKLSVLAAARKNEWNMIQDRLGATLPAEFQLGPLSDKEIGDILRCLESHKYLRELEKRTQAEREAVFRERADKQLLVAMRETTEGRSFDAIIQDEFEVIPSEQGRKAYLWVCSLYLFGVPVRAGLLSRLSGISFQDFREKFFKPCERVMLHEIDETEGTDLFRARHPIIAEIVLRYAQSKGTNAPELYTQILNKMDLGYRTDREAFEHIICSADIVNQMPTIEHKRNFFNFALLKSGGEGFVYQHYGRMEMREGNLEEAEQQLQQACSVAPRNPSFKHSIAVLLQRRFESASSELQRDRYFRQATKILEDLMRARGANNYPYVSYAQILLKRAQLASTDQDRVSDIAWAHQIVVQGLHCCKDKSVLHTVEAQILQALGDPEKSEKAIRQAFSEDNTNVKTALLYARFLEDKGDKKAALKVIEEALKYNELNRILNFKAAELALSAHELSDERIASHLERAFDASFQDVRANRLLGAMQYKLGFADKAQTIFEGFRVRRRQLDARDVFFAISLDDTPLFGKVVRLLGKGRGFISPDTLPHDITFHVGEVKPSPAKVALNRRVKFRLAFNCLGPIARDVEVEQ